MDVLFAAVAADANAEIAVDLPQQTVSCGDQVCGFEIDAQHKHNLLNGLDMIGQTLVLEESIAAYESRLAAWV
jgi:3-isopropylmalate dehydratase small subunit